MRCGHAGRCRSSSSRSICFRRVAGGPSHIDVWFTDPITKISVTVKYGSRVVAIMNSKFSKAKAINPAQIYNEKRRILLSKMTTDPDTARQWLKGYQKTLGATGYAGLKAEIDFFEMYQKEFQLTPALDVGDATDFVGEIDGQLHRIDVTTNIDFKKLETYEPFQADGYCYRIAVWDGNDFELVDINFPFCKDCGKGRILPTGLLLGENFDEEGKSLWSNNQQLVAICNFCGKYDIASTTSTPFLYDFDHLYATLNEACEEAAELGAEPVNVKREVEEYAAAALRYLRNSFGAYLVAVGGKRYEITNPSNGDGQWVYQLVQISPLAHDHLETDYPWEIVDEDS